MTTYGFVGYEDLADERINATNARIVDDAIRASVEEHNRQVSAAMAELVQTTTDYTVRYKLGSGGTLQPLDEWGNPLPVKDSGYYDVAFPIQGGGTAWGDNRVSRAMMTIGEADRLTLGALRRDADWMRRHILAALFDNTAWSFVDEEKGTLTVQPLANGDSVTFPRNNGSLSADNHYYAQADAIADATNPFPAWKTELMEHPGNEGPYVAYVPSNLVTAVKGLTGFIDRREPRVNPAITTAQLVSDLPRGIGDEYLGFVDGVDVVEWSFLPDNYGIVVARGAEVKALGMREYPASGLQGLFTENHSPDGNLNEYRFLRYAGFGAWNRTAALAFRIGNGTYAIPSGYTTPLAV